MAASIRVLPPVIEDVSLVSHLQARPLKFANGNDHVLRLHVSPHVIVISNDQDPSVLSASSLDEHVQVIKVLMIGGQ
jgi:hypothetical protein